MKLNDLSTGIEDSLHLENSIFKWKKINSSSLFQVWKNDGDFKIK
jgi:hypothetical protein